MVLQYKDVRFSAGPGYQNENYTELDQVAFKKSYLDENNLKPDKCFVVYASGNSMSPVINDGDVMLINTMETDPTLHDGRLFAFVHGDECRIKRVYTTIKNEIRMVSDNPDKTAYPDEIVTCPEIETIRVAGRVRWSGGNK